MTEPAEFVVSRMRLKIFPTELTLGQAAARNTADILTSRIAEQGSARVVIATGNSQMAFIRALQAEPGIPWNAITVFHLDEYVGIDANHPASFRRWIRENVEDPFRPHQVHYIQGDALDVHEECERYEALLSEAPLDLVCLGIGENGHIAFNEPNDADFADSAWVRQIELDEQSRKQQVEERHFPTVDDVPAWAISLTVPALLAPRSIQAAVPERRKAEAVRAALIDPVSAACPASILREQPHATLYLDQDSASLLDGEFGHRVT